MSWGGGHSTKNVHGPFEQSFSDPTLNEWLEILISTPKQGNWDKFRPLNAWNYYPTISFFGYVRHNSSYHSYWFHTYVISPVFKL